MQNYVKNWIKVFNFFHYCLVITYSPLCHIYWTPSVSSGFIHFHCNAMRKAHKFAHKPAKRAHPTGVLVSVIFFCFAQGCARFAEIWLKYFEFHILWSLSSVDFHTLTLQLPIQTPNSVALELQAFVSSLEISAKRAQPRAGFHTSIVKLWEKEIKAHLNWNIIHQNEHTPVIVMICRTNKTLR